MSYTGSLDFLNMIKNSQKPESAAKTQNITKTAAGQKTVEESSRGEPTIAVIDTETNWRDEVMSLGVALADAATYECLEKRYYIFEPECMVGGMYSNVMDMRGTSAIRCRRCEALEDLDLYLTSNSVSKIFAYNARFDYGHLPELQNFDWYDIMRIAAYKQYNRAIPDSRPCCKTGRLKSDYGVQSITRLLAGDSSYSETHNAVFDAMDELKIMELMGVPLVEYEIARIT